MAAKVRILALELESPPVEQRRQRVRRESEDQAVFRRQREETAVRHHAFLRQTLPPNDPLVREIERRRSGSEGEAEVEAEVE